MGYQDLIGNQFLIIHPLPIISHKSTTSPEAEVILALLGTSIAWVLLSPSRLDPPSQFVVSTRRKGYGLLGQSSPTAIVAKPRAEYSDPESGMIAQFLVAAGLAELAGVDGNTAADGRTIKMPKICWHEDYQHGPTAQIVGFPYLVQSIGGFPFRADSPVARQWGIIIHGCL